jgi:ABC-type Fe3+-siderophore transport system permease subunit
MISFDRNDSRGVLQNRIPRAFYLILVLALLFATHLSAQTVATYSFEDGAADGWTSFNGASAPVATNSAAYAGSYSLLTATNGAAGPAYNTLINNFNSRQTEGGPCEPIVTPGTFPGLAGRHCHEWFLPRLHSPSTLRAAPSSPASL